MQTDKSPLYVFDTHRQAEAASQSLNQAGFDLKQLSLIGNGCHTEEQPIGLYPACDRIKAWGGDGPFRGESGGLLLAPAVFFIPGMGVVALAGPVVAALVGVLQGAVVVSRLSRTASIVLSPPDARPA